MLRYVKTHLSDSFLYGHPFVIPNNEFVNKNHGNNNKLCPWISQRFDYSSCFIPIFSSFKRFSRNQNNVNSLTTRTMERVRKRKSHVANIQRMTLSTIVRNFPQKRSSIRNSFIHINMSTNWLFNTLSNEKDEVIGKWSRRTKSYRYYRQHDGNEIRVEDRFDCTFCDHIVYLQRSTSRMKNQIQSIIVWEYLPGTASTKTSRTRPT